MFYLPLEISRHRVINYNVNSVMLNLTFSFCLQGAQLRKHIDATLGSGNLREAVRLPPGEDINEWLAVNILWISLTKLAHSQNSARLRAARQ